MKGNENKGKFNSILLRYFFDQNGRKINKKKMSLINLF